MKFLKYISLGATLVVLFTLTSCDKHGDPQPPIDLNDTQKASISMRGVWGQASDASLPFGTTEGVLDQLILEFRIGDDYYPTTFTAKNADYFFGSEEQGTWDWVEGSLEQIDLVNVSPITSITVMKEASQIRVTFYYDGPSGGRVSGIGEYSVTLNKIAP